MDDIYTQLAHFLDSLPAGYPSTESGVELRILRKLFTPEEAALFVRKGGVLIEGCAREEPLPALLHGSRRIGGDGAVRWLRGVWCTHWMARIALQRV